MWVSSFLCVTHPSNASLLPLLGAYQRMESSCYCLVSFALEIQSNPDYCPPSEKVTFAAVNGVGHKISQRLYQSSYQFIPNIILNHGQLSLHALQLFEQFLVCLHQCLVWLDVFLLCLFKFHIFWHLVSLPCSLDLVFVEIWLMLWCSYQTLAIGDCGCPNVWVQCFLPLMYISSPCLAMTIHLGPREMGYYWICGFSFLHRND